MKKGDSEIKIRVTRKRNNSNPRVPPNLFIYLMVQIFEQIKLYNKWLNWKANTRKVQNIEQEKTITVLRFFLNMSITDLRSREIYWNGSYRKWTRFAEIMMVLRFHEKIQWQPKMIVSWKTYSCPIYWSLLCCLQEHDFAR